MINSKQHYITIRNLCLKPCVFSLNAGGYWCVERHTDSSEGNGSTSVTLCISDDRLSMLTVSTENDQVFDIQADYSTANIVSWHLRHDNRDKCRVAHLSVTVAADDNPANCNHFAFFCIQNS